jgi:ribokinase
MASEAVGTGAAGLSASAPGINASASGINAGVSDVSAGASGGNPNTPAEVVCVASWNADLVSRVERPLARGETLMAGGFEISPGGKGSNAAVAAARQGARTALIARVGDDDFGRMGLALWQREGIATGAVEVAAGERSGVAQILVYDDGDNSIAVYPGATAGLAARHARAAQSLLAGCRVVMASCEVPAEVTREAFRIARAAGVTTLLNPAPARPLDDGLLALVDVLTPNETELLALAQAELIPLAEADKGDAPRGAGGPDRMAADEAAPDLAAARIEAAEAPEADALRQAAAAQALLARGVGAMIVTLGDKGCRLYQAGEPPVDVPGYAVRVADTIGAGDCFTGSLAAALARREPLEAALRHANAAAALSVMGHGAIDGIPSLAQVEAFLAASR